MVSTQYITNAILGGIACSYHWAKLPHRTQASKHQNYPSTVTHPHGSCSCLAAWELPLGFPRAVPSPRPPDHFLGQVSVPLPLPPLKTDFGLFLEIAEDSPGTTWFPQPNLESLPGCDPVPFSSPFTLLLLQQEQSSTCCLLTPRPPSPHAGDLATLKWPHVPVPPLTPKQTPTPSREKAGGGSKSQELGLHS